MVTAFIKKYMRLCSLPAVYVLEVLGQCLDLPEL